MEYFGANETIETVQQMSKLTVAKVCSVCGNCLILNCYVERIASI